MVFSQSSLRKGSWEYRNKLTFTCSGLILLPVIAIFLDMEFVSYENLFILLDGIGKMELLVMIDLSNINKYVF